MSERNGYFDTSKVDDVVLGCVTPIGEQGGDIAKFAPMYAGWNDVVAGMQINRFCSSGLLPIALAANYIRNDGADVILAGGIESISMMGRENNPHPVVKEMKPGIYMVMGDTAEVVAKRYKISRQAQDEYSLLSQQRTARAQAEGFFKEEISPIKVNSTNTFFNIVHNCEKKNKRARIRYQASTLIPHVFI